jgi:hypothetical protein
VRKLVIAVVVLAAAGYGLPLLLESATTACSAFEKRFVAASTKPPPGSDPGAATLRAVLGGLQGMSNGALGAEYARREYENLPPGIGCTVAYWRLTISGEAPQPRP